MAPMTVPPTYYTAWEVELAASYGTARPVSLGRQMHDGPVQYRCTATFLQYMSYFIACFVFPNYNGKFTR
jgi:hypothetical protein